jgi:iron complex transport system substrate-binding protein/vitamin B12 transport system substrate-binding protein
MAGALPLIAAAVALASAWPSASMAAAVIEARDDAGRLVTLAAPARRAITLSPHATELVYAAGAGAYLAGSVKGSDYPPEARALPSIGDGVRPSIEAIAGLRPDLVIAWLPGAAQGLEPLLERSGVPVFYSHPERLAELPGALEALGRLFGTSAQADLAAAGMRQRLASLAARYGQRPPVRVFLQVSRVPLISLNGHSIVSDALRLCGGVNVFADAPVTAPQISAEALLAARPQAVVAGLDSPAEIAVETAAWRARASDPDHPPVFLAFDASALYRPGPRLIDVAEKLCASLDQVRTPAR